MNEPPFGFSVPGDPGDDPNPGSGAGGGEGGGPGEPAGQGGVEGPFGPGGPLGDPQQLAEALRQFADLMSYQGGAINWDLAKNIARQTVAAKGDPSVLANERTQIAEALRLADLWLEDATTLPSGIRSAEAWSRSEWVEATMPVWTTLCEPIAERAVDTMSGLLSVSQDDLEDLPPEMRSMMSALSGGGTGGLGALGGFGGLGEMMRRIGGMMVGGQAGAAVGALAEEIISSSDIGLPIGPEGTAALLPAGLTAFGSGLSVPTEEVRLFVALREAAHHRLFSHVPWLRARLLGAVEDYARGIKVDAEALRDAMPQIDPSNPEALNEALSGAALFSPEDSPEQKIALARLEGLLALVEGWVATVVADAAKNRLPQADALAEAIRRRRATGGPAERTFATLVGLELRPRRLREAAAIWRGLTDARGVEGRDEIWGHPDLLPTADDLDDPDAFVRGKPELDISDLTGDEKPDDGEGPSEPDKGSNELSTGRCRLSRRPRATSQYDSGDIHKFSQPLSTATLPSLHRYYPAVSTGSRLHCRSLVGRCGHETRAEVRSAAGLARSRHVADRHRPAARDRAVGDGPGRGRRRLTRRQQGSQPGHRGRRRPRHTVQRD
ncbi:MAG TPA: zinc-dependent metalloprotease [Streptosporangiaceae bacterium]|nr:zinc-dependent metalloprotease [Streptosporangiaceae bacterium]